jgi:hypothetical protein
MHFSSAMNFLNNELFKRSRHVFDAILLLGTLHDAVPRILLRISLPTNAQRKSAHNDAQRKANMRVMSRYERPRRRTELRRGESGTNEEMGENTIVRPDESAGADKAAVLRDDREGSAKWTEIIFPVLE